MDFKNSNNQNQSGYSNAKSFKVFLVFLFATTAFYVGCSSKKTTPNISELVYYDSLEGEIHQLSNKGENTEPYFSSALNKLLFVRDDPSEHKTPQVYEKNMVDKTEKRITFNLGENHNPQYHPTKAWVLYSSSADEVVEKFDVIPMMKDLGLKVPETKTIRDIPQDIYISAEDNSDLKRIIREKGFDGLAVFSRDGEKIYYVKRELKEKTPTSQIIVFDLKSGTKKIAFTEKNKILSLSVSEDLIAWTLMTAGNEKLIVRKLKDNSILFEGSPKYSFSDVKLHPKELRMLVASNLEDSKNKDIYQIDLGEKCATRFSFHAADESHPTFGPEGKSLFFVSNRSKTNQIYATLIRPTLTCKPLE